MQTISKNIITNTKLSTRRKCKSLLQYYNRKRGAAKSWENRHGKVFELHPEYRNPCDQEVELEHQSRWGAFRSKVDMSTLRICSRLSGNADARNIPEDIYVADVEPTLIMDRSVDYIGIKSFYNKWFPKGIFPEDLFHKVDGRYLTSNLENSDYDYLKKKSEQLDYPVILKPNKDSYGGMDINIVQNRDELLKLVEKRQNFVLQKKIEQHDFFNKLYPNSLNTVKVFLYRSVNDDKLHILSMALRMGKDGSLDNEAAGGINTFVKQDGQLNGYAIDKNGKKYWEHPNTHIKFDCKLPDLESLRSLSLLVGGKVFYTRIFALDACYDKEGNWRIIEVNTYGQSIRFSQYGGQPFFGEFTDEVISHCRQNHWALNGHS